ncbi:hypothetical protein IJH74_00505 [Candidatus Saccharibacteria bacterium]|nr:hypothetical protein [Candidatus Saccharibacteria bacterium]
MKKKDLMKKKNIIVLSATAIVAIMVTIGTLVILKNLNRSETPTVSDSYESGHNATEEVKTAVVYFSPVEGEYGSENYDTGGTALLAKHIISTLNVSELEIQSTEPYPNNHQALIERAAAEKAEQARPTYINQFIINQYDTIFLGYPVWENDMPMIIYAFLENSKDRLTGKTIIPFSTSSEKMDNSSIYAKIQSIVPGAKVNTNGFNVSDADAHTKAGIVELDTWLSSLGFISNEANEANGANGANGASETSETNETNETNASSDPDNSTASEEAPNTLP